MPLLVAVQQIGVQRPGPPLVPTRSAQVSLPKATTARSRRGVARVSWSALLGCALEPAIAYSNATRCCHAVIRSFRDADTERVFRRQRARRLPADVQRRAHRKLLLLHAARSVEDSRVPPGNRLEKLSGRRAGEYSIRVNEQWRVCFRWAGGHAHDVEVTDYH